MSEGFFGDFPDHIPYDPLFSQRPLTAQQMQAYVAFMPYDFGKFLFFQIEHVLIHLCIL